MSRIDDDTVLHLLKDSVGEPPYPPDRYQRIVAKAGQQKHRRATEALGTLCVALAVLGSVVAVDRRTASLRAPEDVLMTAASRAEQVGTVRMDGTGTFSSPGLSVRMRISGSLDFRSGASDMTMVSEVVGGESESQRFRIVGGFQYQSIPPTKTAAYSAGKRWSRSPAAFADMAKESMDPQAMVETLGKASTDIREIGRETVRGVRTTRYRYLTLKGEESPETFGIEGGTVEAWIYDEGLPRRISMSMDIPADSLNSMAGNSADDDDEGASSSTTFDLFDYGKPVRIQAPPASEVIAQDDPLLAEPRPAPSCIAEKMGALKEDLDARMAKGEQVDPAEIRQMFEDANKACAGLVK